jgi:hypothetical protein
MVLPNGRVKLTDFGIAQSTDDPRLTTSGILIGSPTYLAPELIRGSQADAGSDLWALAASLFFAVEGHAAFERSSTAATMHAIVTEVPYLTRCHGPLASAIMGLLNATPQARLTAPQVHGLFGQALQGHPTGEQTVITTGPPTGGTAMYGAPTPRKRSPWPFVALVALLVGGAFAGGWFSGRSGLVEPFVDPARAGSYTFGEGGQIPVFGISAGSCGGRPLEAKGSITSSVSCEETHDFEVVADLDLFQAEQAEHPGVDRLTRLGDAACATVFYDGDSVLPEERDALAYTALVPTQGSWTADTETIDRSVYCVVTRRDKQQLDAPVGRQE